MAAAVLLRFVTLSNPFLIAIAALAPWFLALGVVLTAFLFDKKFGAVALVVVVLGTVIALPGAFLPRGGCDVDDTRTDGDIVIASQNVLFGLASPAEVAGQLSAVGPDIILLQEAEPGFVDQVVDGLDGQFEHRVQSDFQVILSQYPLTEGSGPDIDQSNVHTLLAATVATPAGELSLVNVHAAAPHVRGERPTQIAQFEFLAEQSQQAGLVAMGDFNSVNADRAFRTLLADGGLVNAHSEVGCGFGVTWSPFRSLGPALLGLDHAVVGDGWEVEAFEVLGNAGSDHKGIAVRISSAQADG